MNRLWHFFLLLLTALTLTAYGCGDDDDDMDEHSDEHADAATEEGDEDLPEVDCDAQDIPTYDEVAAFDVCTNCHSSELTGDDRNDAEVGVNFDTYDDAKDEAEDAAHEVFEGAMPPAGSGFSLTTAQKKELYLWALCGTPED